MRFLLNILVIFFSYTTLYGQSVKGSVSKNQILIGDHIQYTIDINPGRMMLENVDYKVIDESDNFEIVEVRDPVKNENSSIVSQSLIVTSFDSGTFYLPAVGVALKGDNGIIDTFFSNPIPISVNNVMPDSTGLAPIKPILEEEILWTDYLFVIIPVLLICLLVLFLWYWQKKRNQVVETSIEKPKLPADVVALEQLSELEKSNLLQTGSIKIYESKISEIIRMYLEEKFSFPALEWTTREIIKHFQKANIDGLPMTIIQDVLETSDLVKFAKSSPGLEVHTAQMSKAMTIINSTKNIALEEE